MSPLRCRLLVNPEILCITARWGLKHLYSGLQSSFSLCGEQRQSVTPGWALFSWHAQPWGAHKFKFEDMGLHQAKENPEDSGSPQREGFALGQQRNSTSKACFVWNLRGLGGIKHKHHACHDGLEILKVAVLL